MPKQFFLYELALAVGVQREFHPYRPLHKKRVITFQFHEFDRVSVSTEFQKISQGSLTKCACVFRRFGVF